MDKSVKRARFEKVASNRVNVVLKYLDSLGNCANKSNYEYTETDIRKMLKAVREKVQDVERKFNGSLSNSDKSQFHF